MAGPVFVILFIGGLGMFTTIEETLDWIHSLLPHGMKPGTMRVDKMLEQLDHPERRIKVVHVAGTNGKGSTVAIMRHIYQEAGYKIGTFTSPYITSFNERISVNGEAISDTDLIHAANIVKPLVDELAETDLGTPTEFEVITVIAFYYFGKVDICDLILLEVGLGGRLDSTNVVFPLATVITSIGLDHTQQLGDKITQIAYEKSGIIKSGVPVITAVKDEEAFEVIKETAEKNKAKLYQLGHQFKVEYDTPQAGKEVFSYTSSFKKYENLVLSLAGEHQIQNAAMALMVVDLLYFYYAFIVEEEALRRGLEQATWPGRFEQISSEPLIILDGAHNEAGMKALAATVNRYYRDKTIHVLYSGMSDKNHSSMLAQLEPVVSTITFTEFDYHRTEQADTLYQVSQHPKKKVNQQWPQALQDLRETWRPEAVILITGSLYFISEVRNKWQHQNGTNK